MFSRPESTVSIYRIKNDAGRVYPIYSGLMTMNGQAKQMLDEPKMKEAYLGE